jgi:polysaccharide biosynthesis protein PslA
MNIPDRSPAKPAPVPVQRSRVRFTSNIVGPIFLAADLICLLVSIPLALVSYQLLLAQRIAVPVHVFAFAAMAVAFFMLRSSKRAYRRTLVDIQHDEGDAIVDGIISSLLASALVWQFGLIENYSRGLSLLFLFSFLTAVAVSRPLIQAYLLRLARTGAIEQRVAFYGADPDSIRVTRELLESLKLPHLKIVGVADDRPKKKPDDLPFLGGFEQLQELARSGGLDQVLISVPHLPRQRLQEIVEGLSAVSIDVSVIPPQAIDFAPDYRVHLLGSVPVLTLWQRPFRDLNQFAKRGEDLLLGGLALVLVSPILLVTALLIRLTSPGPIFFVQPRIGFNNEVIHVLKFRSMYADQTDVGARTTTTKDDPRVTPVGRVIRRLSIDELPQLINVMRGDMSLVGPRPHALEMKVGDRFYQDAVRGYAGRHRVRPGITGLAQVKGLRGEIRTLERAKRRVELDKEYIDRWSLWLDLKILLATVRAVLFDRYAY